ncbi:TM2 domain-containing protein [Cereibacter ovatus]|uniref:TM2 domain-containing protein n=1 Tax=Cereibacter ovatus TaxID=439529 RepID=A0A285D4X5_9RHOB|nr:TM2 domain-containing protein [Cereibacter ovatus]SNX74376.1 TM2 domain-containing protein [Cereibacter ovatus]
MKYCIGCGKELHESAKSCPACGAVDKSKHDKIVMALVCFFLGFIGVHRFIVGKPGTAILMILTFGGLGLWVLIDFILILTGNFRDGDGNRID